VSTHESPQSVGVSPPQDAWQLPSLQTSPAAQGASHAPQCLRSLATSKHAPEHSLSPAGHARPHVPALHTSPPEHALSHAPQWTVEVWVSKQPPEHTL
jgi:hypothetical protein